MIKYIIFIYLYLFVQIYICIMLKLRDYLKGTDRIGNIHKYDMKFKSPVLRSVLLSTISLLLLNPHFSPFSFASTSTYASTSASSLPYRLHLPQLILLSLPLYRFFLFHFLLFFISFITLCLPLGITFGLCSRKRIQGKL